MAYVPGTDAGNVRLLINDVASGDEQVFTDEEIAAFLSLAGDVVLLAAALALDTIAGNEAMCSKVIRTQDLQTDGAKVAQALRDQAASLRRQHEEGDGGGFFEILEYEPYSHIELAEG